MPELPEVETIARQLDKKLKGKKIKTVEVKRAKSFQGREGELRGKRIKKVKRVAKMLVVEFSGWEKIAVVHLKMTGQLIWRSSGNGVAKQVVGGHPSRDWVEELPSSHTRVVWNFEDESSLFFNDMRVFGWMKIMSKSEWKSLVDRLPPDVVDRDFTADYLRGVMKGTSRAAKLVVVDSEKLGGVGNIYANDAFNLARVDPRRRSSELSKKQVEQLFMAIREVIRRGIRYGGATYSDFKDTKGLGGKYQDHFLVYKRDGEKCKNCGGKIKKTKLGGRGTFYCPKCQK